MYTQITAKKDLYNNGLCFTKGKTYDLPRPVSKLVELMDNTQVINDLGQSHLIGVWYKDFKLTGLQRHL